MKIRSERRAQATKDVAKVAGMRDEAVAAKTGKTWSEWFAILDKASASKWPHAEIADWLHEKQGVPGWWCQMVTVGYERVRGLRERHQATDGYQVSRAATIAAGARELFAAWSDARRRARWLSDPRIVIRTSTAPKSLRVTWIDGKGHVDVALYPKGARKTQVTVQHRKLTSAAAVKRMQAYWGKQLERLKALHEAS